MFVHYLGGCFIFCGICIGKRVFSIRGIARAVPRDVSMCANAIG